MIAIDEGGGVPAKKNKTMMRKSVFVQEDCRNNLEIILYPFFFPLRLVG